MGFEGLTRQKVNATRTRIQPMNKPVDVPASAARSPSAASLAMIDRLIGFPTVSRDSNLGLIEYARDELARLGVRADLIYDSARNKANLFATLGGRAVQLRE